MKKRTELQKIIWDLMVMKYHLKDIVKHTKLTAAQVKNAARGIEDPNLYGALLGFWCAAWLKKTFPARAQEMEQKYFNKRSVAHG